MASEYEYSLPNGWASPYADGDINGPWLFNVTTGNFAAADTPGGAQALNATAAETDVAEILGPLAFEVDAGVPIVAECEVMVETDASAAAAIFFGFTDRRNKTEEIAIEDEDGTLATNATDAVGFMLEREQDATWQSVSVKNDVDGSQQAMTGASDIADDTWVKLRVEIGKNADTKFYINDVYQSAGDISAAVRTSVRLAPVITIDGRNAAYTVWVRNLRCFGPGAE